MVILDIRNLYVDIIENGERFNVIDGVSLTIKEGEICGLVGENGSGKSIIARIICNQIPNNWEIRADRFHFNNVNLLNLSPKKRHKFIRNYIAMISVVSEDNFDPSQKIYWQFKQSIAWSTFKEPWWKFFGWKKRLTIELFHRVGIIDHNQIMKSYPKDLTDGQKQRVLIAMAIANNPILIIADDVLQNLENMVTQQVYRLLNNMSKNQNIGVLLSTNDVKMLKMFSNRLIMLYSGQVMETGETEKLFNSPCTPYTKAMLNSMPDFSYPIPHKSLLGVIKGQTPFINSLPVGCRFAPRCSFSQKVCMKKPSIRKFNQQEFACHFPLNIVEKTNK